jgi:hypothetical protein
VLNTILGWTVETQRLGFPTHSATLLQESDESGRYFSMSGVPQAYGMIANYRMTMSTQLLETEDRHRLDVGLPTVDDNLPVVVGSSRQFSVPMEVWLDYYFRCRS